MLYLRPTYRLCQALAERGWPVLPGTLTDGLRRLEPLLRALHEKQLTEPHVHGNETRGEVFEALEGKVGHRWYLWGFGRALVVFYRLEPTRGAQVPKAHLAGLRVEALIFSGDRYSVYKCLANAISVIILAFCWAPVRRDFLPVARGYPTLTDWALGWVEAIARLYHLNGQRRQHWDRDHALDAQLPQYQPLETHLSVLQTIRLWGLNPHHERYAWLEACAEQGGQPLPWSPAESPASPPDRSILMRYCGRNFRLQELARIRQLIAEHPRLACQALAWLKPDGGPQGHVLPRGDVADAGRRTP